MTREYDRELEPIESDAIEAAGYLADDRVLTIRYRSGAVYEYYDIEPGLFARLRHAQPHPWSAIGLEVKSHRFKQIAMGNGDARAQRRNHG